MNGDAQSHRDVHVYSQQSMIVSEIDLVSMRTWVLAVNKNSSQ